MAEPSDLSGTKPLPDIGQMTQKVNQYYGVNALGQQPPFKFSFLDAGDKYGRRGVVPDRHDRIHLQRLP